MRMNELPTKFMHTEISCPRQELLDRIDDLQITRYIQNKYQSIEDKADAFDGAFTATQIEIHIKNGGPKRTWLSEVLGWFDNYHKNLDGPFFDGLRTALASMGMEGFYKESIDHIIDNKGKLDFIDNKE